MVDGRLILERRIIANKFNEYFASTATKLNNVENPKHEISSPETHKCRIGIVVEGDNENVDYVINSQTPVINRNHLKCE